MGSPYEIISGAPKDSAMKGRFPPWLTPREGQVAFPTVRPIFISTLPISRYFIFRRLLRIIGPFSDIRRLPMRVIILTPTISIIRKSKPLSFCDLNLSAFCHFVSSSSFYALVGAFGNTSGSILRLAHLTFFFFNWFPIDHFFFQLFRVTYPFLFFLITLWFM